MVYSGSDIRRHSLRDLVLYPPQVKSISEIKSAMGNWETKVREYTAVGGQISDEDKKMTLLKLIPRDMAED